MGAVTDDFRWQSTQPGVMRTGPPAQTPAHLNRRRYLAEVSLRVADSEISWISKSLNAACLRLEGGDLRPKVLSAAYISTDGRLSCIVEAECVEDIDRLFGVALLPSVRVVEATVVALRTPQRESAPSPGLTRAQPSAPPRPGS
jgi:hypothetical protein